LGTPAKRDWDRGRRDLPEFRKRDAIRELRNMRDPLAAGCFSWRSGGFEVRQTLRDA
jgi:hypothetical protein